MLKRTYTSRPFGGRPLDKKGGLDEVVEEISGVDLRTPSEKSLHEEQVWFNKVFRKKSKK